MIDRILTGFTHKIEKQWWSSDANEKIMRIGQPQEDFLNTRVASIADVKYDSDVASEKVARVTRIAKVRHLHSNGHAAGFWYNAEHMCLCNCSHRAFSGDDVNWERDARQMVRIIIIQENTQLDVKPRGKVSILHAEWIAMLIGLASDR